MTQDEQTSPLDQALAAVASDFSGAGYRFEPITGGTMATVWRGRPDGTGRPEVAVRLTPKPAALISRIATLVDAVEAVTCPRTLAVRSAEVGGRTWTVHVCTWIGKGAADKADPRGLGRDIALLHRELAAAGGEQFTDRHLSFERGRPPETQLEAEPGPEAWFAPEQQLPAWYVARHLWRDRILPRFADPAALAGAAQPIHGDLHWDNVVADDGAHGFIDFDKVMHAPRVFDLAKLIATGFFRTDGATARFQVSRAVELVAGYRAVLPLAPAEISALEGFAVILNEQTALLGDNYGVEKYQLQAAAVGGWWARRRKRAPGDPLGLRAQTRQAPPVAPAIPEQPALFTEADL